MDAFGCWGSGKARLLFLELVSAKNQAGEAIRLVKKASNHENS
jgi:hypothetical protein